jgi:chromosome segregation ATPase
MIRAVIVCLFLTTATADKVTPVQKVIELMTNMVEKGKKEKGDEQIQFAAFKTFCDNTVSAKQTAIAEATEMIDVLTADIEKYESEAADAAKQVASLDADISTWEGDTQAAVKVREIEFTDYTATHKDYSETISALEMAIATLMKTSGDVKQAGASLAQVSESKLFPPEAKKVLDSFLAMNTDDTLFAPEANAYEFQSKAIVDMLSKLLGKFDDERTALEEAETNAKHSFDMLKADLSNQLTAANEARTQQAEIKAKSLQGAADSKGALQDTVTTRDDDEKYSADLTATCEQKSTDFANRQILRGEEIEAIQKAIEILAGGAVSGSSDKHFGTEFGQLKKGTSLAQLRSDNQNPNQKRVAAYLTRRAKEINSRVLSAFALRVNADPFKKVKKLVKDLIVKLMEEANAEVEHKGYCDKELATNEHTRKEKTEAVVMLTAEVDELTASIAALGEQIAELTKAISELDAAVAEATEIRGAEQSKNTETIKDAQGAQAAVANALSVLNEFYAKAAEATSFAQTGTKSKKAEPEIFGDEPYQGMGAESGGVVGMIEVIQSDFARLEAETSAAEAEASKQYSEFMDDSKVDKTQKTADLSHAQESKQNQESMLHEKKVDLEGTQKELDAAMKYYDKLKPTCVKAEEPYEDRVAKRKEEIESLQEALRILNGEDVVF